MGRFTSKEFTMKLHIPASNPAEADKLEHDDPALQGEGDYKAARNYRKSLKRFVDEGKVEAAAKAAAPRDVKEQSELKAAEQAGLARSRH
jgi:hypothetical protein